MKLRLQNTFVFLTSFAYGVAASCRELPYPPSRQDVIAFVNKKFDYLVLGGGTAGVALAARLAEYSNFTVGVVEAGDFHRDDPLVNVPALSGSTLGSPSHDWNFVTQPQVNAGFRNISLPRGKMLGGSSGINLMAYNRASSFEYDVWQEFARSSNWSWDGLLPFFKKAEHFAPKDPFLSFSQGQSQFNPQLDGFQGPISASYNELYSGDIPLFVQSLNAMGINTNLDPTNGHATGVYNTPLAVDRVKGVRSYSATEYYCNRPHYPNLHILLGAQVTRIHLSRSGSDFVATGAQISVASLSYDILSRKEVILSAGSLQTPHILELSGIGNSAILERVGIPTVIDIPSVGENFQEHLYVGIQWKLVPGHQTFDILRNASFAAEQQALYNKTRSGLLAALDSTLTFVPMQALVNQTRLTSLLDIFDKESQGIDKRSLRGIQSSIQRSWFTGGKVAHVELIAWSRGVVNPAANESYVFVLGGLSHPTSRGSVHTISKNPLTPPVIDAGFLNQEFDTQILLDVLKFVQNIGKQAPFSKIVAAQTSPDPSTQSDANLIKYIRGSCAGGSHIIGTAAMAPRELGGVVDASLRVYGTKNLRIVDASIFPIHIAAHTQATIYAIAEMTAMAILEG